MRETREIVTCDLCKFINDKCKKIKYPVVFTTEQNEGRRCDPYISYDEIDVCPSCERKILMVRATGAMGHNDYRVVEP